MTLFYLDRARRQQGVRGWVEGLGKNEQNAQAKRVGERWEKQEGFGEPQELS